MNTHNVLSESINFIGRKQEIEQIQHQLGRVISVFENPQNCNIIGEPGIGKSALLRYIHNNLLSNNNGLFQSHFIEIDSLPIINSATFWQQMLAALKPEANLEQVSVVEEIDEASEELYYLFIEAVEELIKENPECRIILIIDNADILIPRIGSNDIDGIRALITRFSKNMSYIISGQDSLYELCKASVGQTEASRLSPLFFNIFLHPLIDKDAEDFIAYLCLIHGIPALPRQQLEYLMEEAGGHPRLLILAFSYLLKYRSNLSTISLGHKNLHLLSADFYMDIHVKSTCQSLYERRTDNEKSELSKLAHGIQVQPSISTLGHLITQTGLVRERHGKLAPFANVFAFWIREVNGIPYNPNLTQSQDSDIISVLEYQPERGAVKVNGHEIPLSETENRLMDYFWDNSGRICTTEELLKYVWNMQRSKSIVEKTVNRLRSKIEIDAATPTHILSKYGKGYLFEK